MTWKDIFRIELVDGGLSFWLGPLLIVVLIVIGLLGVIIFIRKRGWNWRFWTRWEAVSADIPIGNLGTVTIHPNHESVKVAYKSWIELATRKAALPFDEDHDVVVEVYRSWYELFGKLRELAKEIPAHQLRKNADTQELVRVMLVVLNEGLRPHLTRWQARFRAWYEAEIGNPDKKNLCPQEIQRQYPEYGELIHDLKGVSLAIVKYAGWLRKIAEGQE